MIGQRAAGPIVAVALLASAVIGCSESERRYGAEPSGSPCSTGPAHPAGTQLPDVPLEARSYPTCTPRCGYDNLNPPHPNGQFSPSALPSGACSPADEECSMQVDNGCSTDGIVCSCRSGSWQCGVYLRGGGVCPPPDAGTH